jgi:hypothetical protein
LQQYPYLSPEPHNDFAYWTSHVLNEATLGEQLSSVDIIQFHSIMALRLGIGDLNIDSTAVGGGVAEILTRMIPLLRQLR